MRRPPRTGRASLRPAFALSLAFALALAVAARAEVPAASSDGQPAELVDISAWPDAPVLDIRYATKLNFTGEKLYAAPVALLRPETAAALARANLALREMGYGLRVFDAYRPPAIQRLMWGLVPDERYVSNPAVNMGRHTRGTAVDVALTDLMGNPLPMPSGYDDFTEKAHRDYKGASPKAAANRDLLERVMKEVGFEPFPTEWWHFDLAGWEKFPVVAPPPSFPLTTTAAGAGN